MSDLGRMGDHFISRCRCTQSRSSALPACGMSEVCLGCELQRFIGVSRGP